MKRIVVALGALLLAACVFHHGTPIAVVYAQSVPVVVHPHWDPPPATANVLRYEVTTDGTTITVPASACAQTDCSAAVTVTAFGRHTTSVLAINQSLSNVPPDPADAANEQRSASASRSWDLLAAPAAVTNLGVKN